MVARVAAPIESSSVSLSKVLHSPLEMSPKEVLNAFKQRDMESLDSEDERTLLPAEEARAGRGESCSRLWPEDPEEALTTGFEGRSSRLCLGRAASLAAEVPAPRPAFTFLPERDAQLRELISVKESIKSKYELATYELILN